MSTVICPFCNASLPPQEVIEGWCETCGKKLPPFARGAVRDLTRSDVVRTARQPSNGGADTWEGPCDLCERTQPSVSRCYLKVTGQSIGVTGSVRQQWVNVRCTCCPSCFRKARSLQTLRYTALGVMFASPAFLCGGLGLLVDPLEKRFGVPRSVTGGLVLSALALCIMIWLFSPFYIRFATRRRLRKLLNPALDERLKALVGVTGWGWRHYVTALRRVPETESVVDLRGI